MPEMRRAAGEVAVATAQNGKIASTAGTSRISFRNASLLLSLNGQSALSAASPGQRKLAVSYEEEDEPYKAVPASNAKTLKVNVDLMLWRSRQARIKARMTLDKEQRRLLYKESEDTLRRCLSLDPSDPRTYVVLGKTLLQQKRYEEARKLYSQGTVATANNSPYIWSAWGWLEFKTNNTAAARKLFDAAVVVDDTHACAWHKWGMLERSEGNFMRARDLWMQGIQKCRRRSQSQNAYLYNALAVMAAQVGRVEEARAWFEEGTRTLEGAASVALWQAWAVLEAKQGDPTAVRYLFKRALGVNPKSRYVHLAWAMWERKQRNVELCLQLLQRGQSLNPSDPAIYQAWAIVEKERGNYEKASALFEAGVKADPSHLYLWQAWGCMEASRDNHDRARELFQEGVWADPTSRDTLFIFHAWGVLEKKVGNVGFARELFKAAIKVDPKSENVWATWIAMEEELGLLDRADDLRMRQSEQQWEFEVPYNFTTRPRESPLSTLIDTLANFFTARKKGSSAASGHRSNNSRTLQQLLPEDFDDSLTVEDIIPSLLPKRKTQTLNDLEQQQQVPVLRPQPLYGQQNSRAVAVQLPVAQAVPQQNGQNGEQQGRELMMMQLLQEDSDGESEELVTVGQPVTLQGRPERPDFQALKAVKPLAQKQER